MGISTQYGQQFGFLGWKCGTNSTVTTALFDTFAMTKFPSNRAWQVECARREVVLLPQNTTLCMLLRAGGRKWPNSHQGCVAKELDGSYLANGRHIEKLLLCVPWFSEI